jgi:hypothetical protein
MEKNNKLALYVGYFLARFNKEAYKAIGFGSQHETHVKIGEILAIKSNTIRNMRDEFDPLFEFRAGFHQRPLSPSRVVVAELMENYSFVQSFKLIDDILSSGGESVNSHEVIEVISDHNEIGSSTTKTGNYSTRGITGRKAEKLFEENYLQIIPSFDGELINTSLNGTGYDFKNSLETKFVEVKGAANEQLGILLTDKEWEVAKKHGNNYYLVLIYSLLTTPTYLVLNNPANKLSPQLSVQKTVVLNWNLSHKQLQELNDGPLKLKI